MTSSRFVLLAALATLIASSLSSCRRTHHSRLQSRPRAKPEELQTWEGEGGNLKPAPKLP
jgi:hypothetical protein